jgi:outer membrane lipoprotein-sorting protein
MKKIATLAVIVSLVGMLMIDHHVDAAPTPQILTGVLNKMEKAHQALKSLKAELIQQKTNPQINITDTEYGQILYKPATGKEKGKLRIDYTKPSKDVVALVGEVATFYQPRINQAWKGPIAKVSKSKGYGQLAGLDGSLKSLTANHSIDILRDEQVNGQMTTVLRLSPKGRGQYASTEVWVSTQTWLPVQWKLIEHNGDFTVYTLKNPQVNASIPDSAFAVNLPSGTKIIDKW